MVCLASPLPLSWAVLQRNSLTCRATPGNDSGSTSACLWPWSEGTLPAYWLILAIFNALTSVPACYLPLQWIAIAFQICVFFELYYLQYIFYAFCKITNEGPWQIWQRQSHDISLEQHTFQIYTYIQYCGNWWDSYNKMQKSQFRQLFSFSYDNISSVSNNKLRSTKLVSDVSFWFSNHWNPFWHWLNEVGAHLL